MATDPLHGGPTPSPNPGADPVNVLAPKAPGQPSHDDHDTSGPPAPEVIARGYEEDVYDAKTVLSVPALVVFFFVLAFGITTAVFLVLAPAHLDPAAHPQAQARNKAPLNERLARTGRGKEVDQPRLEPLKLRDGESRAITRPELSVKAGNSPELHPEDLVPNKDRYPELFVNGKDRIGLDKTLSLGDEALKKLFKSSAPPLPADASATAVTGANAGRGFGKAEAVSPKLPETATPKNAAPAPPKDAKGGKS
ncbi:hypothetical protein R5W23_003757 [Gemmata sp. JC673]|uniref:Uncharacterized protein n=1 Tax=Gemmata algarum TaxID=2975278 RepID=A0ABU5F4N9_9BACT|nr:hypothetical protein [Gemmata algarum]MDY3562295.1 hypothetical protein [Gemmata algarum]